MPAGFHKGSIPSIFPTPYLRKAQGALLIGVRISSLLLKKRKHSVAVHELLLTYRSEKTQKSNGQ
jgi:hypothetical protein